MCCVVVEVLSVEEYKIVDFIIELESAFEYCAYL